MRNYDSVCEVNILTNQESLNIIMLHVTLLLID